MSRERKPTKITTLEIRDQDIDVFVDESGRFTASCADTEFFADTLDKLRTKLMAATKQQTVRIEVPFSDLNSDGTIDTGTVVGVHAGTRNFLVMENHSLRHRSNQPTQQPEHTARRWSRPVTEAEATEWRQLCVTLKAAQAAIETFRRKVGTDIAKEVKQKIEAAMQQGG